MSTSTTARRSRTTSTSPTTARCSARSSTGSRTSSTGGTTWARRARTDYDVYLRTAISVDPQGWAHFGYVKMPRLPLGHLPQPGRRRTARSTSATTRASRPGRTCRASTAPTCAASSSRRATPSRRRSSSSATSASPRRRMYDLRNLFQINVEEGRHLWAMVYLLHKLLRPRRPRGSRGAARAPLGRRRTTRASSAPSTRRRPTGWRSSCSPTSPTATASSSSTRWPRARFDPLARTTQFMLTEEAHHMFVGESGVSRVIAAHLRR